MRHLRQISTRRLLALCAAVVVAVGAGAAIAVAATSGGPRPPARPLAVAVHDALAAPPVAGVTARIAFTNHLVDTSGVQGAGPLLSGASGRLWASRDGRLRLELQSDGSRGDGQLLVEGRRFTFYDPTSNTLYRGTLPRGHERARSQGAERVPTLAAVQRALSRLAARADLTGARPDDVAGRPAYSVRISPRHSAGLLGGAELAWDAANGVPLRAAVYAADQPNPVLELAATDISFGAVPAAAFTLRPPAGARVVDLAAPASHADRKGREAKPVTGLAAVAHRVPFRLRAPASLVGLPRTGVRLIRTDGAPAALVTYGRNLGGMAIVESAARPAPRPAAGAPARRHDEGGLQLPQVSIAGASGTELGTALGTVVRFQKGGVSYVVAGSVPAAAAEAAARGLGA